jgi:hypothetical protein
MLKKIRTHLCPLDGGFQLKSCNVLHRLPFVWVRGCHGNSQWTLRQLICSFSSANYLSRPSESSSVPSESCEAMRLCASTLAAQHLVRLGDVHVSQASTSKYHR